MSILQIWKALKIQGPGPSYVSNSGFASFIQRVYRFPVVLGSDGGNSLLNAVRNCCCLFMPFITACGTRDYNCSFN